MVLITLPTLRCCEVFQEFISQYDLFSAGFFPEISHLSSYQCNGIKFERIKITLWKTRSFYYFPGDTSDKVTKIAWGRCPWP